MRHLAHADGEGRRLPLRRVRVSERQRGLRRKERVLRQRHAHAVRARPDGIERICAIRARLAGCHHRAALHERDDRTVKPDLICVHRAVFIAVHIERATDSRGQNRADIQRIASLAHRQSERSRLSHGCIPVGYGALALTGEDSSVRQFHLHSVGARAHIADAVCAVLAGLRGGDDFAACRVNQADLRACDA